MLIKIEYWLQFFATLTGIVVIIVPLLSFRRADAHVRGRSSGAAAGLLRWPVMLAQTILFVAIGILLWRPLL